MKKIIKKLCFAPLLLLVHTFALAGIDDVVYFHPDSVGSATYAYNANGDICWEQIYAPYGEKNSSEDLIPSTGCGILGGERGYTGHVQDISGLVYMKQRYYDPELMRFLSVDPIEMDYSDPRTYNRYAYAYNNPYRFTDPTGEIPFVPIAIFLAKEIAAELASQASGGATDVLSARRMLKKGVTYAVKRVATNGDGAKAGKYDVGPYNELKTAVRGNNSGLDAHHVGQKAAMKRLVEGYDPNSAPAILVPAEGHTVRRRGVGVVSRKTKGFDSARDLVARDIRELRRVYPDVPNSQLRALIDSNRSMYPRAFRKR